ncbi:MAG: tRNA (adenine(22)-N(1))-methyltransferase TrmK, partial [Flavobacteriaceae bacterium]|nr:tRNA (adenine(22)-N(1))-methyltransferase TrmK [Flavobacteriaceae bacterium]
MARLTTTSYSRSVQSLSDRIKTIVSMVPSNRVELIWDLCCDHGQIGEQLVNSNNIIFIDQVESIILNLKHRLATDIPSSAKYKIIKQDCINFNYKVAQRSCFILAGIGGILAIKIIGQILLSLKENDYILVSAHNNDIKLRSFLIEQNLGLVDESLIKDNNIFYEVLLLKKHSDMPVSIFGSLMWSKNKEISREYLVKKINYFETKLP